MAPTLVLASNSPRRRQLLALTGLPFITRPVEINEDPLQGEAPDQYVLRLAAGKARAAIQQAQKTGALELILTADTTVADGMEILGKPSGAEEARAMLRGLRGREHTVYTAIGVSEPYSGRIATDLCATRVWMRGYSDAEIEVYIASGDPFDKAGGYAIQHPGFHPVERIEGCYACVVGLPVCHVVRALADFGLRAPKDISLACPAMLDMHTPCPAVEQTLRGPVGKDGGSQFEG